MITQTKNTQEKISPLDAKKMLIEGNERFIKNQGIKRDLLAQVKTTSNGQFPFAVVLGCIDSRVPNELVFDQGIGDIFSTRVAGSVINEDVLGSIEYSCKVAGSKIVVVLGHTKCGAVTAACKNVELGNITHLLAKIKPAVDSIRKSKDEQMTDEAVEKVIVSNVNFSIEQIRNESPILNEMENNGEIMIVGANYDVNSGIVEFL